MTRAPTQCTETAHSQHVPADRLATHMANGTMLSPTQPDRSTFSGSHAKDHGRQLAPTEPRPQERVLTPANAPEAPGIPEVAKKVKTSHAQRTQLRLKQEPNPLRLPVCHIGNGPR